MEEGEKPDVAEGEETGKHKAIKKTSAKSVWLLTYGSRFPHCSEKVFGSECKWLNTCLLSMGYVPKC